MSLTPTYNKHTKMSRKKQQQMCMSLNPVMPTISIINFKCQTFEKHKSEKINDQSPFFPRNFWGSAENSYVFQLFLKITGPAFHKVCGHWWMTNEFLFLRFQAGPLKQLKFEYVFTKTWCMMSNGNKGNVFRPFWPIAFW